MCDELTFAGVGGGGALCVPCVVSKVIVVTVFCIVVFLGGSGKLNGIPNTSTLTSVVKLKYKAVTIFSCVFLFCAGDFVVGEHGGRMKVCGVLNVRGHRVTEILVVRALAMTLTTVMSKVVTNVLFSGLVVVFLCEVVGVGTRVSFTMSANTIMGAVLVFKILCFLALVCGLVRIGLTGPVRLLHNNGINRGRPGDG